MGGVQKHVEGAPLGQGEVGSARGGCVRGTPLGAPAELLAMGEVGEVVDGHPGSSELELTALLAGWQ